VSILRGDGHQQAVTETGASAASVSPFGSPGSGVSGSASNSRFMKLAAGGGGGVKQDVVWH
jgi:hypothetical protein